MAYDLRCSLLEEGRLGEPPPAMAPPPPPRLVQKPKKPNPPWVRAFRAFGNTACLILLVFIFAVMVPRSRDEDHLFGDCVVSVILSLAFPAMAYTLTMGIDEG